MRPCCCRVPTAESVKATVADEAGPGHEQNSKVRLLYSCGVQRCEQQLGGVLGEREHVKGLGSRVLGEPEHVRDGCSKVRLAGKLWWPAAGSGLGWQLKQEQDLSKQVTGGMCLLQNS
jgi:hypothetical protein